MGANVGDKAEQQRDKAQRISRIDQFIMHKQQQAVPTILVHVRVCVCRKKAIQPEIDKANPSTVTALNRRQFGLMLFCKTEIQ